MTATSWPSVALGDLISIKTGKLDSNAAVTDGQFAFFTCSAQTLRTNSFSFDGEYVLLAGNNANGDFPIKYFCGQFDAYQRTYVIEPLKRSEVLTRYLFYSLIPKLAQMKSVSTGSATKFLTLPILRSIEIGLPPLEIQRKIANILSAYDDLIDNNNRRIKLLEEMAQRIFREWFIDFRFPRHEDVTLEDSALGPIPKGWATVALRDICTAQRLQYQEDQDGGLPLLDMARMRQGSIATTLFGAAQELTTSRIIFERDDLLFGSIRPNLWKVAMAPCKGVTNTSVHVLRARTPKWQPFIVILLASESVNRWATQHANGTKMPVMSWRDLGTMPTILPSPGLCDSFSDIVQPMLRQIQILSLTNQTLSSIRLLLLPKFVSNRIDVTYLSTDLTTRQ